MLSKCTAFSNKFNDFVREKIYLSVASGFCFDQLTVEILCFFKNWTLEHDLYGLRGLLDPLLKPKRH